MTPSAYSPLTFSNREIRLVTIIQTFESSAPIECATITVSLDQNPPYHALSYCWGDPNITVPINVNGIEVQVTENLNVALLHFRAALNQTELDNQQFHLWIDAVCINQSDSDERGQQLQLMRNIYSEAITVFVWLGEEDENGRLALQTISRLYLQFGSMEKVAGTEETLKALIELEGSPEFDAILTLFERPWWTRLWTVQEYVFGKEVTFFCGNTSFSWYMLNWWSLIITVKTRPEKWKFEKWGFLKLIWGQGCAGLFAKSCLRQEYLVAGKVLTRNMSTILGILDCMMCSDPRDRIYAVQELVSDGYSFGRPDYSISTSELYIMVAGIMAETHQNLEILKFSPPRSSTAPDGVALPSWVPDWGQTGYPRALSENKYNADLGRKAVMHYFTSPISTLHAHGIIWDTVTGIDSFPTKHFFGTKHPRAIAAGKRRDELRNEFKNVTALSNGGSSRARRVIWCSNCCGPVLDQHFHCIICDNGDFDLCFGCIEDGVWCAEENHKLVKRHIVDNELCISEAEEISHGAAQEECKVSPEDTPGWARLIYEGRSKIYPTGIPQLQAYFRTILFDQDYFTNARLSSSEDSFFELAMTFAFAVVYNPWYPPWSEIARWQRDTRLRVKDQPPLPFKIFLGDPGSEGALTWPLNSDLGILNNSKMRSFYSVVEHQTRDRQFFVTSRGYMGLGPRRVEVGDLVCVFPGSSVPIIMRKKNGHYTNRGECFIHGIMDGEVMKSLEEGNVSLEELEIH